MAATQKRSEDEILRGCDRSLSENGLSSAREVLAALAEETDPDERMDMYGSGVLIEGFEREIAELLGKEAAVFVPSGTMAQQIALRIWSDRHGSRTVAFHPTCHLEIHEQKGYQALHGLFGKLVGNRQRLITLADLEAINEPVAALLLELPQREIGGQLPAWEDLEAQIAWARERGIATHMDGARLWEAGPFYGRSYAEIAGLFDSVYVSFYKGVAGMAGAALAGPEPFVKEARVWIRRHGGNLIRLFPYVVSARANLRLRLPRFVAYHQRALAIARVLGAIPGIAVKPDPPHTNMMHVYLPGDAGELTAGRNRIAEKHGVILFHWLSPSEIPGYHVFELSIGDATDRLTDEEIGRYFAEVVG